MKEMNEEDASGSGPARASPKTGRTRRPIFSLSYEKSKVSHLFRQENYQICGYQA